MSERFLQAKDVAAMAHVDEKYFRSFLRKILVNKPGRGGRYMIPESAVETLLARFEDWPYDE